MDTIAIPVSKASIKINDISILTPDDIHISRLKVDNIDISNLN